MGYLKYRHGNKTYEPLEENTASSSGLTSNNNLCLYMNTGSGSTAQKYYPGFAERGTNVLVKKTDSQKYYIDNSSPSICFKKNGTIYYVAKSLSVVNNSYIPAVPEGKYTGQELYDLIKKYFPSSGTTRYVFTVDSWGEHTGQYACTWQYAQSRYSYAGLLSLTVKTKESSSGNSSITTLDKIILKGCSQYQYNTYPSNYWSSTVSIVNTREIGASDSISFSSDIEFS